MNVRGVNEAKKTYLDWFASDMSKEAVWVAMDVQTLEDLESYRERDHLSAGEFDAIESVFIHDKKIVDDYNTRNTKL